MLSLTLSFTDLFGHYLHNLGHFGIEILPNIHCLLPGTSKNPTSIYFATENPLIFRFPPQVKYCILHFNGVWFSINIQQRFGFELPLCFLMLAIKGWPSPQIWMFFFFKVQTALTPTPPSLFGNYIVLSPKIYDQNIPLWNQQNLRCNFLDRKWPPPPPVRAFSKITSIFELTVTP